MLFRMKFEVYGRVQGVFFRRETVLKALSLGIVGWVKNTSRGTVEGIAEGDEDKISDMRYWLGNIGSRGAIIDKLIEETIKIDQLSYGKFQVCH